MIKIAEYNDDYIKFNDKTTITFEHYQDCCECNYADFTVLDNYTEQLTRCYDSFEIEPVNEIGFNLILKRKNKYGIPKKDIILIPCYSDQNGYYSTDITICVKDKRGYLCEDYQLDCELRYE